MANEFIARKGLIALDNSGISGSLDVSGSLTIESSGSTLFEVVGSEGQLFSITDSLSGSLFAVSDVSGLPILEAFSDDTVKIGTFNNEAITVSGSHTTIGGVLAIPGFTNVSASLAAAVAGGDNLGNHTATQDLNMGGNAITNVGNVDGVDVSALNSTVSTNTSNIATLTAATSSYSTATGVENNADVTDTANVTAAGALMDSEVTNLAQVKAFDSSDYATAAQGAKADTAIQPADTGSFLTTVDISSDTNLAAGTGITLTGDTLSTNDSEIDHDSLSNFSADEHFTQANITTVGTVTSGDVSAILPSGVLSGSAQIASDISGAFTAGGGISLSSGEFSVAAGTGLTQGATGLSFDADGGTLTTNNADVDHILINDGGTFKRITKGNINVGDFNNDAGYLTSSPFTAAGISGSFTSTSASIATDISNLERLSKGRITYLYTSSNDASPTVPSGYIHYSDSAQDRIILSTSSYNGVDLDASLSNDYSDFQYREVGSLLTVRKVSDGSFKTYKVTTVTTDIFGVQGQVGYLVDQGSFTVVVESGSISNGDEVEFIWDKSAGVGGAYGPTEGNLTKTFAGLYQPGYNYLDMFFGKATDTEFDGSPENLSGVESSASFATPTSYFLPAISQSESLTLGGLTVNGTITGTTITGTTTLFDTGSSTLSSNGGSLGDIVKFGGSTTIAGGLYYLNSSGGWTLAQADTGGTSTGSLAVALGTNSTTDGMLLRGFVNPFGLSDAEISAPVYVASASAGRFSGLPSQQTGEIVRVVGHAYGSDLVYFNPSNNWIEL